MMTIEQVGVQQADAGVVEALRMAASNLIAVFDELRGLTVAERIITARSDAELRKAGNDAIEALRAALSRAQAPASQPLGSITNPPATRECANSPDGKHQVDTSMESGPSNCFHCEQPMGKRHATV